MMKNQKFDQIVIRGIYDLMEVIQIIMCHNDFLEYKRQEAILFNDWSDDALTREYQKIEQQVNHRNLPVKLARAMIEKFFVLDLIDFQKKNEMLEIYYKHHTQTSFFDKIKIIDDIIARHWVDDINQNDIKKVCRMIVLESVNDYIDYYDQLDDDESRYLL